MSPPQALLERVEKKHVKNVFALVDSQTNSSRFLDFLVALCLCNGFPMRNNQNMIAEVSRVRVESSVTRVARVACWQGDALEGWPFFSTIARCA